MDVSKQSGYADYEWAIELNRFTLTLLGVWPRNTENKLEKLISSIRVIITLSIIIWMCIIPTLHSLFRIWGDILLMVDNLLYTLPILMVIIKYSIIWYKEKDILMLLNMIKYDWLKPKTAQEWDVMLKKARIARLLTILGYFIMLASAFMGIVLPFFGVSMRYRTNETDPGRLMPLQTYYLYDREKSPLYEITYVLQSIGMAASAMMYSSTDCFLSTLVFHVCGQLENLKARIINLDKFNDFHKALSCNVQEHERLIRFIYVIDNIFNLILLGALLYFGILFALEGFFFGNMITQGRVVSIPRIIFMILVCLNTFSHTCLYCAVGEILTTQCEGVYEAAYRYKWYILEPKKAKNLLMIMVRTNKSLHLTAGKFFPMTMALFCNLLKTSGGYISVLLAYRE